MDSSLFDRLSGLVRAGARAVGIDTSLIVAKRGTVAIHGSNVDIWWLDDALGRARPGWQVRETDHVLDLVTGGERVIARTVVALPPEDVYGAARAALMAATEWRLKFALGEEAAR